MNTRRFTFHRRAKDAKPYQVCMVAAGNGKVSVEVTESPNGRTAYVHVNGVQVYPASKPAVDATNPTRR